jgi:hypothetical protein
LHHIFSFRVVAQDCPRDAVQALVVPSHYDFKKLGLAIQDSAHNLLVREWHGGIQFLYGYRFHFGPY